MTLGLIKAIVIVGLALYCARRFFSWGKREYSGQIFLLGKMPEIEVEEGDDGILYVNLYNFPGVSVRD